MENAMRPSVDINWCNFCEAVPFERYLIEFKAGLQQYPELPPIQLTEIVASERENLSDLMVSQVKASIERKTPETTIPQHLIVFCDEDWPAARLARSARRNIQHGVAVIGCWAMVWHNDKFVTWHEAAHLLFAHDCYDEDNPLPNVTTCGMPECLMKWNPNKENCQGRLHLCKKNLDLM